MKSTCKALITAATLAASILVTGCTTPGYKKSDKTAANLQVAANNIKALPSQINKTLASLQNIIDRPQADLRPQYKQFTTCMAEMKATANAIAAARKEMAVRQKELFAKWDQEVALINNEDIKARSQNRKDEVNQKLTAIKLSYAEVEGACKPFMSDLKDVEKFLAMDLTTAGVAAIKEPAAKANANAMPVKAALAKLAADFKALGVSMSSATVPPPAPK